MLLVAQRVVSLAPYVHEGVNAFCYLHGAYSWLGEVPPAIEGHAGELVNSTLEIDPPFGNRVRSYLDIYAPDMTPTYEVRNDVLSTAEFIVELRPLPWRVNHRDTTFAFDVDGGLAAGAFAELAFLLERALAVRVGY